MFDSKSDQQERTGMNSRGRPLDVSVMFLIFLGSSVVYSIQLFQRTKRKPRRTVEGATRMILRMIDQRRKSQLQKRMERVKANGDRRRVTPLSFNLTPLSLCFINSLVVRFMYFFLLLLSNLEYNSYVYPSEIRHKSEMESEPLTVVWTFILY